MKVTRVELDGFRSYGKRTIRFSDLTVIVGANASGKTNVLEAIYMLSSGDSFRAGRIDELVNWDAEIARVTGIVEDQEEAVSLGLTLTRGQLMGRKTQKRRFLVDGNPRTKAKFGGRLLSVLFRPEDLRLIEGSPTRRRMFLDEVLTQSDREYGRALKAYDQALRRRNKILDSIREGEAERSQLAFWDATIIKNGNYLTDARREFVGYLEGVEVEFGEYRVEYDYSAISEKRLAQYAREEVLAGYTLVGPHKDDIIVRSIFPGKVEGQRSKDLHVYGSRGEQRLGVLFLKLGSMNYIERKMGKRPVLLLDDIFSELDEEHRQEVLKMAEGRQTIITTADEYLVDEFVGKKVKIIRI